MRRARPTPRVDSGCPVSERSAPDGGRGAVLAATAAACVIGVVMAVAGSAGGTRLWDAGPPTFAVCVLIAFVVNWVAFVPSVVGRTERFYDLSGSLTYLAVTATALIGGNGSTRSVLLAAMV